jgi:CDP-diacylglycerol--glycerol-3-phosphate 3-phosphatidyltransferase
MAAAIFCSSCLRLCRSSSVMFFLYCSRYIVFQYFPSYHTWGAKLAAVLIAPAYYLLVLYDYQTFFQLVILFHLLVAVEEMAITLILKRPQTNIHSILQLRNKAAKK